MLTEESSFILCMTWSHIICDLILENPTYRAKLRFELQCVLVKKGSHDRFQVYSIFVKFHLLSTVWCNSEVHGRLHSKVLSVCFERLAAIAIHDTDVIKKCVTMATSNARNGGCHANLQTSKVKQMASKVADALNAIASDSFDANTVTELQDFICYYFNTDEEVEFSGMQWIMQVINMTSMRITSWN